MNVAVCLCLFHSCLLLTRALPRMLRKTAHCGSLTADKVVLNKITELNIPASVDETLMLTDVFTN